MNIFYINKDPKIAAQELADKHILKMQIESAQLCCAAHWLTDSQAPYKLTHKNHPSSIWTRQSIQHYRWVVQHGIAICEEFKKRYGKEHKTKEILIWLRDNEPNLPNIPFTPPPQCMPDAYKQDDTVQAYKQFYIEEKVKGKQLNWNKLNNKPAWLLH